MISQMLLRPLFTLCCRRFILRKATISGVAVVLAGFLSPSLNLSHLFTRTIDKILLVTQFQINPIT